ncbi:hypothetical protein JR327_gp074 [Escherichia phage Mt1B1_P17]|uniref:Uncharacterized protein n=1 Tax=Escherichia phage Mt1B1_P17 TaxID=2743961 RepID=A0A7G8L1E9_9CAUD|nr:hypothetical protein JR327_gp074 [Escherichia phage Mt1B1_P17]QNJ49247.1 hypothetical protein [Escherichia phage Mt1B1_P17]
MLTRWEGLFAFSLVYVSEVRSKKEKTSWYKSFIINPYFVSRTIILPLPTEKSFEENQKRRKVRL